MVCKNCGIELEEGAAFCQNCGTKVETEPAPEEFTATAEPVAEEFVYDAPPVPVTKKKSKAPIIILIVVLVLLLLVLPIAILLLVVILGGGAAALLAIFGMAKADIPGHVDTPNSGIFSEFEENLPDFEYDTDEGDGGSGGIIGGAVEDDEGIANIFSDPDNTYYTDGEITINPTYVYWDLDGSLVVEANVVNGKSFTVGDIELDKLSVYNGKGELIASGYFGRLEDLTLDSHYYEEWEFTFSPEYTIHGTDLSGLYCVAEFYYDF